MRALIAILSCALAACPGARTKGDGPAPAGANEIARRFPVATQIPGGVTHAMLFRRLDLAASAGGNFLAPFPKILIGQRGDYLTPWSDDEFRQRYGFAPFNPEDLIRRGFANDRSFAFYSTGTAVTMVFPVADRSRVLIWFEDLAKLGTVVIGEHRGLPHATFTPGGVTYTAALGGEWLYLHARSGGDRSDLAWLDGIVDRRGTLDAEEDLAWVVADGRPDDDAVGLIRSGALLRAWDTDAAAPRRDPALAQQCRALEDRFAAAVGRIAIHGKILTDGIDGTVLVELSSAAQAELGAHLAPPPDGREGWLRQAAGLVAEWMVDLDWLGEITRPFDLAACGEPFQLLAYLGAGSIQDPVTSMLGTPMLAGYGGALVGARKAAAGIELVAGGWSRPAQEGALRAMLVFAGDTVEIAGVDVVERETELEDVINPTHIALDRGMLWIAVGAKVMERLLTAQPAAAKGDTRKVGGFWLNPKRFEDLDTTAWFLARVLGGNQTDANYLAWQLRSYQHVTVDATLAPQGIRLTGGFARTDEPTTYRAPRP